VVVVVVLMMPLKEGAVELLVSAVGANKIYSVIFYFSIRKASHSVGTALYFIETLI
jgi:hypothetical protein